MMICEPHIWGRGADLLKYLYEMMQLEIKVLKYAKINIECHVSLEPVEGRSPKVLSKTAHYVEMLHLTV